MSQIFNDDEFKQLDFNKQKEILSNYFNSELADDEFKDLSDSEQSKIKDNFLIKSLTDIGAIKPREDGAGFLTRTKFGLAKNDKEKRQVLEDEYGKNIAIKTGDRWLVYEGKGKGWNAVDEKGLSWGDIGETLPSMIEPVFQTIGAVGGGALGGLAGGVGAVPGTVAGGTVGTGAARSVKDLLRDILGVNDREDKRGFGEKLVDKSLGVVKDASYGGVAELGGIGVGKLADKYGKPVVDFFAKPFAKSMRPDAEIIKSIAKNNNITLLPSDLVQTKGMARLENVLNQGFAGQPIAKVKDEQFKSLQKELTKYLDDLGTNKTDTEFGRQVIDTIKTNRAEKKQYLGGEYDKLGKAIEDLVQQNKIESQIALPMNETKQAINNLTDSYNGVAQLSTPDSISLGGAILKELEKQGGGYQKYDTFKKQRTDLIGKISMAEKNNDANLARELTLIKKSMDNDLNSKLVESGLGAEKKALDKENASFKSIFENKDNIVGTLLNKNKKDKIKNRDVGKAIIDNVDDMERVQNALNGDSSLLKQAYANKLKDKSIVYNQQQEVPYNGYISTSALNSEIGKNSESFAKAFTSNEQQKFSDLTKLGGTINYTKNVQGNPSGTGKAIDGLASAGLFLYDPTTAITATGGRYLGSKLYTSEMGKKWLTDGFDVGNGAISQTLMGQPARRVGFYEAFKGLEPNENNK